MAGGLGAVVVTLDVTVLGAAVIRPSRATATGALGIIVHRQPGDKPKARRKPIPRKQASFSASVAVRKSLAECKSKVVP